MRTLLLTSVLLIAVGSLYPFDFHSDVHAWSELFEFEAGNLADAVTNTLLFAPFGFLLTVIRRGRAGSTFAHSVLISTLFGIGLQIGQLFLSARDPDLADAFWNVVGAALGCLLAIGLGLTRIARSVEPRESIPLLLSLGWLTSQSLPVITAWHYAGVGLGIALTSVHIEWHSSLAFRSLCWSAALGLWWYVLRRKPTKTIFLGLRSKADAACASNRAQRNRAIGVGPAMIAAGVCTALLVDYLWPYQWRPNVQAFHWLPFESFFRGSLLTNTQKLLEKLFLYGTLLWAIALALGRPRLALYSVAGLIGLIEYVQTGMPNHTPEISDLLMVFGLAFVFEHFRDPLPTHPTDSTPRQDLSKADITLFSIARIGWYAALGGLLALLLLSSESTPTARERQPTPVPNSLPAPAQLDPPSVRLLRTHPRLPAPTPEQMAAPGPLPPYLSALVPDPVAAFAERIATLAKAPDPHGLEQLHRALTGLQPVNRGHEQTLPVAQAYDWLYDHWTAAQRATLERKLREGCDYEIEVIRAQQLSPYNVYLYNSPLQALLAVAIALGDEHPENEHCWRFAHYVWVEKVLPVWQQVMGTHGGWHEGGEYVGIGVGQAIYRIPAMWHAATGLDAFADHPGIRGFLDFLVARTRPNGRQIKLGDGAYFHRDSPDRIALALAYEHAAAYALNGCPPPNRVSSWPWGPLTRNQLCHSEPAPQAFWNYFDGIGLLIARSDLSASATYVTFKAGDNYWSHSHLDQGSFTIFKGAPLAIDSGVYGPFYGSDHHMNYAYQTIAHNALTVTDPSDRTVLRSLAEGERPRTFANDGGQRRIGSGWGIDAAPLDFAEWNAKREIYHTAKVHRFYGGPDIVAAVADLTPAYTNRYSDSGRFSDRTRRVERYWRSFVYDRSTDVVVIHDRVTSTRSSFIKRFLLHSIEEPIRLKENHWQIPAPPGADSSSGKPTLEVRILWPESNRVDLIGGPHREFFVDGRNYDEQGKLWDALKSSADGEFGRWRLEISPATSRFTDSFLVVLSPSLRKLPAEVEAKTIQGEGIRTCIITKDGHTLRLTFPERTEGLQLATSDPNFATIDLTVGTP